MFGFSTGIFVLPHSFYIKRKCTYDSIYPSRFISHLSNERSWEHHSRNSICNRVKRKCILFKYDCRYNLFISHVICSICRKSIRSYRFSFTYDSWDARDMYSSLAPVFISTSLIYFIDFSVFVRPMPDFHYRYDAKLNRCFEH